MKQKQTKELNALFKELHIIEIKLSRKTIERYQKELKKFKGEQKNEQK